MIFHLLGIRRASSAANQLVSLKALDTPKGYLAVFWRENEALCDPCIILEPTFFPRVVESS